MQLERFVVRASEHPAFEVVTLGSYKQRWRAWARALYWRLLESWGSHPQVWVEDKLDDKVVN